MIIRATSKLHNIAGIKAAKMDRPLSGPLPGEWYASLLSTGRRGGSVIHFLHNPCMISILVLGRSLNKALDQLPVRLAGLLSRNGFAELMPGFELFTQPEIYTTNSRSILANMTQMKMDLEYNLALLEVLDPHEINSLEDMYLTYLTGGKIARSAGEEYIRALDQLNKLLSGRS